MPPTVYQMAHRRTSSTFSRSCTAWVWEILACVLSIVALGVTAITLHVHKGHPLPQWPLSITINVLLSIYSVIFKASVSFILQSCLGQLQWLWFQSDPRPLADISAYDGAGRGTWGSIVWLHAYHVRHPLAAFAAIVSVVSIATEPSFQQIIRLSDCPNRGVVQEIDTDTGGLPASMPRTNYVDGTQFVSPGGAQSASFWREASQSALASGPFSPVMPLAGHCPTGNCTFDIFHTAGYCSTCRDVSADLKFRYECRSSQPDGGWTPVECNSTTLKSVNTSITSYLPSNTSMVWDLPTHRYPNVLSGDMPFRGAYQPSPFEFIRGKTYFSENAIDPLTGVPINETGCSDHPADSSDWRCRGYGAASCMLYPCVRSYNVSVLDHTVTQLETSHTSLELLNAFPYWNATSKEHGQPGDDLVILDLPCLSTHERQELAKEGYNLTTTTSSPPWLAYRQPQNLSVPISPDAPYPLSMFTPNRTCAYTFNKSIDHQLRSLYHTFMFMLGSAQGSWDVVGPYRMLVGLRGSRDLHLLYNATNTSLGGMQKTFDTIADSITAYIRTTGHPGYSLPALGTAFHYAVCLEVTWAWIALPSVLAAGVVVLLPLTMVFSVRGGVPVWKSSSMPLAFRGPLTGLRQQATGREVAMSNRSMSDESTLLRSRASSPGGLDESADSILDMEREAKKMMVQLEKSEGRSRLVLVEELKG